MSSPPAVSTTVEGGRKVDIPTGLYINGEWVVGHGEPLDVYNPATEELLITLQTATEVDVDVAVKAAREAFHTTWGNNIGGTERGRMLYKLADLIDANREEIVSVESADSGKPYRWSEKDIDGGLAAIRYYAGLAGKISGSTVDVGESDKQVVVRKEPIGVVAQITPWNYPFLMWAWKVAPALAAGCCIVFKAAENTPLHALVLVRLMEQAGLPKGVFNLVNGIGRTTGQAMADHMDVDKIAFTGSTGVGRHIVVSAAKSNLKTVTLELGGKSPNLIFPSANIKEAAKWSALGIFETTGQSCIVGSRILVHESIYDEFLSAFVAATKQVEVGKTKTALYGSLVSEIQFSKVMEYIAEGKSTAKLQHGGERVGEKGFFVQPTIFSEVDNTSRIAKEEIFGPVSCVIKFKDEKEALALANDTTYGLAGAVHSRDHAQVMRVSSQLKAGTVWVNQYGALNPAVPFGGMRQSGWGRELGQPGLENYLTSKAVHHYYGGDLSWPI